MLRFLGDPFDRLRPCLRGRTHCKTPSHACTDFDFAATHQRWTANIVDHSSEPLPYAFRASAYLFAEMDRLGILESEFLIDDEKIAEKGRNWSLTPQPGGAFCWPWRTRRAGPIRPEDESERSRRAVCDVRRAGSLHGLHGVRPRSARFRASAWPRRQRGTRSAC